MLSWGSCCEAIFEVESIGAETNGGEESLVCWQRRFGNSGE